MRTAINRHISQPSFGATADDDPGLAACLRIERLRGKRCCGFGQVRGSAGDAAGLDGEDGLSDGEWTWLGVKGCDRVADCFGAEFGLMATPMPEKSRWR